ncbi:DUF6230 family protein [Micromonospora eburnea]|uniref:Cholesterol esterase n=1 Tax=Micromonospora eburnea TaxID=227316 RepID=A0A1C6VNI4_9ACTN|nr:DUF6230 family protein [Micromonospora eburnea]SCL67802.1 hypothetical protein GA0070604_6102 [Micromonospora eburnea]
MSESEDRQLRGGTRWRRFAAMAIPAAAAAGGIMFGMANGAIAANITVSGTAFKVGAERLEGDKFTQYGGVVYEKDNPTPVPIAISEIGHADLYKLCQSVDASLPGMPVVLRIEAGGGKEPATADGMLIAMESLAGDAKFTNIKIGQDASDLSAAAKAGTFGQSADHVTINGLQQVARYTTAGTFNLKGLKLKVHAFGDAAGKQCF